MEQSKIIDTLETYQRAGTAPRMTPTSCMILHSTRHNTHAHAQVLNLLPMSVKDCTFRDLHIDQSIINAQK